MSFANFNDCTYTPGFPVVLSLGTFSQEKAKLTESVNLTQVIVNSKE